jgi:hypothetical protein
MGAKVVVVPDDEDVGAAALDVTDIVRQLWHTHQWCIDNGYDVLDDHQEVFEGFRAFAGLPTQADYEAEKIARFRAHQEWLERMRRTDWGRKPDAH